MRVLIAGLTTRAIAESAVRAGYDVITVDYFGDLDQKRLCANVSLRERGLAYGAQAIQSVARDLAYDALAYCGGLENAPDAVAVLAAGRRLLGNEPETLRRVRDPAVLLPFLASRGWRVPRTLAREEARPAAGAWLRKPVHGGGGQGVRVWRGQRLAPGQMLQEYVAGVSASAIFVADGRGSRLLACTEQLHRPRGFAYGGNILPLAAAAAILENVRAIAEALTGEFALRGVNGLDFVLDDGGPVALEVNPRYSASMELFERATGVSVFELHLRACEGALPAATASPGGFWGKAIVYASTTVSVGDTVDWIAGGVRDVPHPGEIIAKGHPICTVFASAPSRPECWRRLRAESEVIRRRCSAALPSASPGGA